MCVFSSPSVPAPAAIPASPPPAPQASDQAVQQAQDQARQQRTRAAAGNSTLVTGGQGLIDQPATGQRQATAY